MGENPERQRRALLVVPVPCDLRLFRSLMDAVASRWERENSGKKMATDHLETRQSEFGDVVVVWSRPLSEASPA